MDKGKFVISIDTELSWGTFDHGGHIRYRRNFENVRTVVDSLLDLFHKYRVSATWAVVGHLFLDSCKSENGKKHPEMPHPKHSWYPKDWYSLDPCTSLKKDPLWYGRDIVEKIRSASPQQEIGSHSFSHAIFSDSGCGPEVADAEFSRCQELAKELGIQLTSFVFPRNEVGHLDLLVKNGFQVYRGIDDAWFYEFQNPLLRKAGHFADDLFAVTPRCVKPYKVSEGLTNLPGSMLYRAMDGVRTLIPVWCRVRKGKRGLDRAAREQKVFHLWFHTFNLGYRTAELINGLEQILSHADTLRKEGKLEIASMNQAVNGQIK